MSREEVNFETWLDRTFGRAVSGEWYPQFVEDDATPGPVPDHLAVEYLTRLFEQAIIERLLAEQGGMTAELELYARAALTGCIQ